MIRLVIAAACAALLVTATSRHAAADPEPMKPAVKKKFDRALAAFSKKDYKTAARGFAEVYESAKRIDVLFAWAQATRLGGDCGLAVELYRKLEGEAALGDRDRAAVEKGIRKCGAEPGEKTKPDTNPPPDDDGVDHDDATTTDTTADEPTTGEVPTRIDRAWYTDGIGDALAASGAVTAGFGVALFVLSASDASAAGDAQTEAEHIKFEDRAKSRRTFAVITLAAGGALIGGAVYRYLTRDKGSDRSLAVWSSSNGLGVALGGAF